MLPKPSMSIPIDTMNDSHFDAEPITFLPEDKQFFDDPDVPISFYNKFHGTVPERTRNKVCELAKTMYRSHVMTFGANKDWIHI